MDRPSHTFPAAAILVFAVVAGGALGACSSGHPSPSPGWTFPMPTTTASMATTMAAPSGDADAVAAIWDARPDFVRGNPQTEEAYQYTLQHPEVVQWMPCYCGCGGMGHRSNRDCYFKPALEGRSRVYEEHASFCDICVRITLKTKQLVSEGRSLREVRSVIDQTFGGSVPGTATDLPPA